MFGIHFTISKTIIMHCTVSKHDYFNETHYGTVIIIYR